METVAKIEAAFAAQYKKAPHLPKDGQKWLAANMWWIVLIGAILGALGIVSILGALSVAWLGLSLGGAFLGGLPGMAVGTAIGGVLLLTTLVSLALYIAEVVLLGMAVSPLKAMKKQRGWDNIFLVVLLNVAVMVVINVLTFNLSGLVFGLLWMAIGTYFLFEVRDRFMGKRSIEKTTKARSGTK